MTWSGLRLIRLLFSKLLRQGGMTFSYQLRSSWAIEPPTCGAREEEPPAGHPAWIGFDLVEMRLVGRKGSSAVDCLPTLRAIAIAPSVTGIPNPAGF